MKLKKPKMIIFDYGNTLLFEPDFNPVKGNTELFKYITKNEYNLTAEEFQENANFLFEELAKVRAMNYEINELQFQRLLNEYSGVEFSISYNIAEHIFWENSTSGAVMPYCEKVIDYINTNNIRSAVISNITFTENALKSRINRLLPNNKFEYIMTSSEYIFRKPHPILFGIAVKKSGLSADEIWYCGDNITADVEGASGAGIIPVWYECLEIENPYNIKDIGKKPKCEHLHINSWLELIKILEELQ